MSARVIATTHAVKMLQQKLVRTAPGTYRVPRPLPQPPRLSTARMDPRDELGRLLDQWVAEARMGYTLAGD